jgi:hypothetical protein
MKHANLLSALEQLDVGMICLGLDCTYECICEEAYDAHSLENLQVALKSAMSKCKAEPEQVHLVLSKFEGVLAAWKATSKDFKHMQLSRRFGDPEVGALLACFLESRADPENSAFVKLLVRSGYIPWAT